MNDEQLTLTEQILDTFARIHYELDGTRTIVAIPEETEGFMLESGLITKAETIDLWFKYRNYRWKHTTQLGRKIYASLVVELATKLGQPSPYEAVYRRGNREDTLTEITLDTLGRLHYEDDLLCRILFGIPKEIEEFMIESALLTECRNIKENFYRDKVKDYRWCRHVTPKGEEVYDFLVTSLADKLKTLGS